MIKPSANPRRLWQLSPREDRLHLAPYFRNARSAVEGDLPRLHWRVRHTLRQRAERPRRVLRIVLAVGLLFVAGGSVTAALHPYWHRQADLEPAKRGAPDEHARPPARRKAAAPPAVSAQKPAERESIPSPAQGPADMVQVVKVPQARLIRHTVFAPALSPPPAVPVPLPQPTEPPPYSMPPLPPSPLAIEQAMLGGAVKALRKQHDSLTALALLDEHAQRFPHSLLGPEASMLRAEALLGLGRKGEALSAMDGMVIDALPNRSQRLVLRGELRATVGRWQEAREDFDAVLNGTVGSGGEAAREVRERALWGRATARSHAGDEAGARADLALYLRTFPTGRFAAQAAVALKGRQ